MVEKWYFIHYICISLLIANHHPHHNFWYYVFEGTYFILQGISAKIQAIRILKNLPISHFYWALGMILIAMLMVIAYKKLTHCKWKEAIELGISLFLVRFLSFTPWLNKLRGLKWFYLGKESVMDRLLMGWYPIAWYMALIIFIIFQL